MASNEARKDIVNDMIWDHENKLLPAIVECKKRELELLVIQRCMSSKQSQVAAMMDEYSRLERGCRLLAYSLGQWYILKSHLLALWCNILRLQLVVFAILRFPIVMLL
jgi:hypothetical protein